MQKKAPFYNYYSNSQGHRWISLGPSSEESERVVVVGRGRQDRWPDFDKGHIPCHVWHTLFKAEGSWGSLSLHPCSPSEEDPVHCSACNPDPDSDLCIPESSSSLQSRIAWCFLAAAGGTPGFCHPSLGKTVSVLYILCFSLIINIINIINVISKPLYIQLVSLSPFSSFSFRLVGGWALIESICHRVCCRLVLKRGRYIKCFGFIDFFFSQIFCLSQ